MKILYNIITFISLISCVNNTKIEKHREINNHKDSLIEVITIFNTQLKNKNILTEEGYKKGIILIENYRSFIKKYNNDSLIENYLFDLIMYQQGLNFTNDALKSMEDFIIKFPENPRTPELINMQASIYDIEYHDEQMAKKTYLKLINNYPDNPLSIKAQEILDNGDLDLTIEERVHKWQKQN